MLKVTKCIFVFDGTSSGDICGGKTFGGKKEESRWGAIVGEGVMDHPRIGGTHRLQDTNTKIYRHTNIKIPKNINIYKKHKYILYRETKIYLSKY